MTFTLYDTKSQLRQSATLHLWNVNRQKHFLKFNFSWMSPHSETFFFFNVLIIIILCCCESSYFIWRYVISFFFFWTSSQNLLLLNVFWLALKYWILKCIMIYTNKAIEPRLPLKYLVYPKRSFHLDVFFFNLPFV